MRAALERIHGQAVSDTDWRQLRLPTKFAGVGLRSALSTADAAYYASRTVTFERCVEIYPSYGDMDRLDGNEPLAVAVHRINQLVTDVDRQVKFPVADGESCPRQQQIMTSIYEAEVADLHNAVGPWSSARLRAYSTAGAGRQFHAEDA